MNHKANSSIHQSNSCSIHPSKLHSPANKHKHPSIKFV